MSGRLENKVGLITGAAQGLGKEMAKVMISQGAKIIISDSGGVQEEAPSLGKPVLLTRSNTERPEALDSKTVMLVGTDKNKIKSTVLNLFKNEKLYKSISKLKNPYGDGTASKKIVKFFMNLN